MRSTRVRRTVLRALDAVRTVAGRLRPPSETPREAHARRAVEVLLGLALVVSLVLVVTTPRPLDDGDARPLRSLPIDLAHDPPWALRLLPGLGPKRVRAIVAARARNGPPSSLDDLG